LDSGDCGPSSKTIKKGQGNDGNVKIAGPSILDYGACPAIDKGVVA
jgi:hypothetical protein